MNEVLAIKNLNFKIQQDYILKNISLTLHSGDFAVLLGHNGSGKSSLLKAICKQIAVKDESIVFLGKKLISLAQTKCNSQIALIDQYTVNNIFAELTIAENIKIMLADNLQTHLQQLKLFNVELAKKKDTQVKFLSGGQKQMLSLFLAVERRPKLLLLDEHTAALDPKAAKKMMEITNSYIRSNGITCLMVTHNLDDAVNYGNKTVILKEGKVVQVIDKTQEKYSADCLRKYF